MLILDGHKTHSVQETMDICQAHAIDTCFLPPHTSHILQPLDIGIFNSYKALYRKSHSEPMLEDITLSYTSEATQERVRMLGRALVSNMHAVNSKSIRRSFYRSGIFPLSFSHFLYYSHGVRDIPPDVQARVAAEIQDERESRSRRANAKGRRGVVDSIMIVDASVDI